MYACVSKLEATNAHRVDEEYIRVRLLWDLPKPIAENLKTPQTYESIHNCGSQSWKHIKADQGNDVGVPNLRKSPQDFPIVPRFSQIQCSNSGGWPACSTRQFERPRGQLCFTLLKNSKTPGGHPVVLPGFNNQQAVWLAIVKWQRTPVYTSIEYDNVLNHF